MLHYLVVFYLIISKIEINVGDELISSTTENYPSNSQQLFNIQSELIEIQNDIILITNALGQNDGFNLIPSKILAIKDSLRHIADKLITGIHETNECSDLVIKILTNHYQAVNAQLKNLQLRLRDFKQKLLPSEIAADIMKLQFDSAQEKIKELKNISDISKIIHDVYESSSDSFELLAKLVENLSNKDLIYTSVKALYDELSSLGYGDPYKWMRVANLMETQIVHQPDVNLEIKESAKNVVNELYQSIREFTVKALKDYASRGSFTKNGRMYNLTVAVYIFDPSHSESIIEQFVDESFENQEYLKNILNIIESHKFIQQRVRGIIALFWKIKDSHKTNHDVMIDIASSLYKIHSDEEVFKGLSRSNRIGIERIIEALPTCARNLYFLSSVCFWNKAKEEYLTLGNSTLNNDHQRRNIFLSEDPLPGREWFVHRIGENFLFSSRSHPNEYLYAADFNFNRDYRYLFSWIPGNNTDKQSKWNIHLNGEYCSIESEAYNENMISSNYKTFEEDNMQLTYVFTYSAKNGMGKDRLQWQIRKCN